MQGVAQQPSLLLQASTAMVMPLTKSPSHSRIFRTELATLQSRCICYRLLHLDTAGMSEILIFLCCHCVHADWLQLAEWFCLGPSDLVFLPECIFMLVHA